MGLTGFARVFLELEAKLPRADRVARGLAFVLTVSMAGALLVPWLPRAWPMTFAIVLTATAHVVLGVIAVAAWRAGVRQARLFVLAFGVVFATSILAAAAWLGKQVMDLPVKAQMVGSLLEMLLLSFAVAERFAEAQARLAVETERRRALQEAYADELEAEVRSRTRELEEANADKDRMLSIIGHDLRGPLTGLMRSADDEPGNFARETERTGRALLLLIEDLVLWARLRAGTRQFATHPARALLAPAVALHRSLAEQSGTELSVSVPDDLRVETDLVLAQTLVRNLLANALKFARRRVVLSASAEVDGSVRFTVGNDGPPLPPAVAARFAAGENEPITATGGLGLRLCREICRAFGTRLVAGIGAGGGTEFSFTLRTAQPAATVLP
jgi:signal transduction histidine kinase